MQRKGNITHWRVLCREQTFRMQIDTGSGDTFISVFCPDCDGPGFAPIYEPNKSTTAVNKSTSGPFSFDNGDVVSYIFADTVRFGEYSVSNAEFCACVVP